MPLHDARSLLAVLGQHDLISKAPLDELRPLAGQFPGAADLARELVRRGLLTTFQANEIMQDRAGRLVLGQYLLLERLGQGGMGEVFKARHRVLDRLVALKIIRAEYVNHPDAVERFRRECRAAGRLSHPNIVAVQHADQVGDVHFMAMEYLEGQDLGRLLKEHGALPPGEACEYVRQAALGLQHAHEQGMVHRDVKPANLMRTTGGVVKVLDLGLARLRVTTDPQVGRGLEAAPQQDLTRAGSIMGTPDYIAPEQATGDSAGADIRADVYSLGCTLFHLLTGRPPFAGKTVHEKIAARLTQPPPRADEARPGLPVGLSAVVLRMMQQDPAARHQTPGEVAAALARYCQVAGAAQPSTTAPRPADPALATLTQYPQARRPFPWRLTAAASAILVVVAVAAVLTWALQSSPAWNAPGKPPDVAQATDKDNRPARPPNPGPGPGVPIPIDLPPPPKHAVREGVVWPPPECVAVLGDDAGRHWGEVQCVAFHPKGQVIASADRVGGQGFIHLWDADSLKERAMWTPAGPGVQDMAYSPDGLLLAAACGDCVRLWDAGADGLSNEHKFAEPGVSPGSNVSHVLFTSDGQSLLTWDAASVVRKWRLTKGKPEPDGDPNPPPPQFYALAVSADGRTMSYSRPDKATGKQLVCVKTMFDKQAAETTAEVPAGAGALALSGDGKRLAARMGSLGEVRIWDINDGKLQPRKPVDISNLGSPSYVPAFLFTPDGSKVVDVSAPRGGPSAVWFFDATTGAKDQLDFTDGPAASLSMSADGRMIAMGGRDHRLRRWRLDAGRFLPRGSGPAAAGPVQRLTFQPGATALAMVSRLDERPEGNTDPSNLMLGDVAKGKIMTIVPVNGWFTDCAYTPDGARLFAVGTKAVATGPRSVSREGFVRVWYASGLEDDAAPNLPDPSKWLSIESLAFDRDGKTLALLGGDDFQRRAAVCSVKPFSVRGNPFDVGPLIDSLALAPHGETAAVMDVGRYAASPVPFVKFWDLKDIEKNAPPGMAANPPLEGGPGQTARRLTFALGGKAIAALVQMAAPSDERKVLLWDVAMGSTRAVGDPEDKRPLHVEAFAFSPDGRFIATADADGRVTVWRADKPDAKIKEWQFPGPAYSVAFSDAGDLLAVGDGDGTIAVMRLAPPAPNPGGK
jgi:serine/threonine protein kinase/WD40 repeat protein